MTESSNDPRKRYLARLLERYGNVVLPIGLTQQSFGLEAVFQPLRLRSDPLAAEDLPREQRRALLGERSLTGMDPAGEPWRGGLEDPAGEEPPTGPILAQNGPDALAKSKQPRMVILGGPGTGKTTVLKDLLVRAIHAARIDDAAPLPIFIALPDLARTNLDLRAYLGVMTGDLALPVSIADVLWAALTGGGAFLCLDSLDEVAPALRPDIIALINRQSGRWGGNWIVGSRFTEYKGGQFGHDRFAEWELTPLDHDLRQELARRLLAALGGDRDPIAFVVALEAHAQARAWGENPLLLSLAAVGYARAGALPTSRVALYREVIAAVLTTRTPDPTRQQELLRLLATVALELYQVKGRTFNRADLRALVADASPDEQRIEQIINCGVLDVVAHETYGFRHQTFQEYLAAVALAGDLASDVDERSSIAWNLAWSKRTYSRWTEVLRLMVGVLVLAHGPQGAEVAQRWVTALLAQRESDEGDPGHLGFLLALRSVAEAAATAPDWGANGGLAAETAVVAEWAQLKLQNRYWEQLRDLDSDIQQLDARAVHDGCDVLQAMLDAPTTEETVTAINALGSLGPHIPVESLITAWYARDHELHSDSWNNTRSGIIAALNQAAPRVPVAVLLAGSKDSHYQTQQAAYAALAKLGKMGDTTIIPLLVSHLESPACYHVVTALGDLGGEGVVGPLLGVLQDADRTENVRGNAATALGKLGELCPVAVIMAVIVETKGRLRESLCKSLAQSKTTAAVQALSELLTNADADMRKQALQAIQMLAPHFAVEIILPLLHDPSVPVRQAAIGGVMARFATTAPVEPVHEALWDPEAKIAGSAAYALKRFGKRVPLEMVLQALDHPSEDVVRAMIDLLGQHGSNAPFEPLVAKLGHPNPNVRNAAARAIGKIGNRAAVPALVMSLADEDWSVRRQVAEALTLLGEPGDQIDDQAMLIALRTSDVEMRRKAIAALRGLEANAPMDLLLAQWREEPASLHDELIATFAAMGKNAPIDIFIEALQDAQPKVRMQALTALAARDRTLAASYARQAIIQRSEFVQPGYFSIAADSLDELPLEALEFYTQSQSSQLCCAAIGVLSLYGQRAPLALIIDLSHHLHTQVRAAAIQALARLGRRVPLEVFVQALNDISPNQVGMKAADALAMWGEAVPQEPLLLQLAGDNPPQRAVALRALMVTGNPPSREQLLELMREPATAAEAARALALIADDTIISALLDALETDDWSVGNGISKALIPLGDRLPRKQLEDLLHHQDQNIRRVTMELCKALSIQMPVAVFLDGLRDPDSIVQYSALEGLRTCGAEVPLAAVFPLLDVPSWIVRIAAIHTLIVLGADPPLNMLIEGMHHDEEGPEIARDAIIASGARIPVEPLQALLADSDSAIAAAAHSALAATHPDAFALVAPEAERILRDGQAGDILGSFMQFHLARTIGSMRHISPALFATLTDLLDWHYQPVRHAAIDAFKKIRRNIPDMAIRKLLAMRHGPDGERADDALSAILSLEAGIEDD